MCQACCVEPFFTLNETSLHYCKNRLRSNPGKPSRRTRLLFIERFFAGRVSRRKSPLSNELFVLGIVIIILKATTHATHISCKNATFTCTRRKSSGKLSLYYITYEHIQYINVYYTIYVMYAICSVCPVLRNALSNATRLRYESEQLPNGIKTGKVDLRDVGRSRRRRKTVRLQLTGVNTLVGRTMKGAGRRKAHKQ